MVSTHEETVSLQDRQPDAMRDTDGGHWRAFRRERGGAAIAWFSEFPIPWSKKME